MNISNLNSMAQRKTAALSVESYLRLFPTTTEVYRANDGLWTALTATSTISTNSNTKIERLIFRGVLVPDIVSNKEYIIQRTLGIVDHRAYRLQDKIAAKYQFSYDTSKILSMIENLIRLCDYDIFDDSRGPGIDGQKILEIIPRDNTKVYDYLNNLRINPVNPTYYIDPVSFNDMRRRGIIVLRGTKWKLSRNYWAFNI